jgi:hypothetical protein
VKLLSSLACPALDWFTPSRHSENRYHGNYEPEDETHDLCLDSFAAVVQRRQHTIRARAIVPNAEFVAVAQVSHRRLRNSLPTFLGFPRINLIFESYYCLIDGTTIPVLIEDQLFLS